MERNAPALAWAGSNGIVRNPTWFRGLIPVVGATADDQRPLVQERGHLLPLRRDLHGRERRRRRRFFQPDALTILRRARRTLHLSPQAGRG